MTDDAPNRDARPLLIVSQVYVPDPAAVGQHMHDAAATLARRGHRVIVYAARHGYDDPTQRYPRRETRDGVEIRRLPFSSFGKRSLAVRLLAGLSFVAQVFVRGLFMRRPGGVVVSTSPPMAPLAALGWRLLRRVPFVFWAMDINPDQLIAMGRTRATSWPARLMETLVRATLRRAACVVTLDRFMADRLQAKVSLGDRLRVIPPWPCEREITSVAHAANPFRKAHGLEDKFVIMYSGNHSPAHPLNTILQAAKRLQHARKQHARDAPQREIVFLFVGGGLAKAPLEALIEREQLSNVRTLPYQPLEQLHESLSAADVHLVAMGESMVGIVHPCKLYSAMAVARPILLLGPRDCHVGEIIEAHQIGWQVDHGDVDAAVAAIQQIAGTDTQTLSAMGERARAATNTTLSQSAQCDAFCDVVERAFE